MITLTINNKPFEVDVSDDFPLLWALRDVLGFKGTKFGCGMAQCGACSVIMDKQVVRSCSTPVSAAVGTNITTIEAVGKTSLGKALQKAWLEVDVAQCGYCQAGQIISAYALLADRPKPTDADIDEAMQGNLCRCATYQRIRQAIKKAAGMPTEDHRNLEAKGA